MKLVEKRNMKITSLVMTESSIWLCATLQKLKKVLNYIYLVSRKTGASILIEDLTPEELVDNGF